MVTVGVDKLVTFQTYYFSTVIQIDSATNETKSASNKIVNAFRKIRDSKIHTLVFLYSGHHSKEEGFLVGKNVGKNDGKKYEYILIEDINNFIKGCRQLKKIIAFMDCCQPEVIRVENEQCLIQFNATSYMGSANSTPDDGSIFTKLLVQALNMKATGSTCLVSGCDCSIDGFFITPDSLKNYIEHHRLKGALRNMEPERTLVNINWKEEYLAYNYTYAIQFRFSIELPELPEQLETSETHSVLPTDLENFKDLIPKILFPKFVELFSLKLGKEPKQMSHTLSCADCLCITYDRDTKCSEEIDNLGKLHLAWNSKRLLYCKLRSSWTNHELKPAGFFLAYGKNVQKCMIECISKKTTFDYCGFVEIMKQLKDREKRENDNNTRDALKHFIGTICELIPHDEKTQIWINDRKLNIQFLDLFEESSDSVVKLSLIEPDDEIYRRVLNRTHEKIVEEMDPDSILNKLLETGFVSHDNYEDIRFSITDRSMKNRMLVNIISQSGKMAYCEFKQSLQETNQKELVHKLESTENEFEFERAGMTVNKGRNKIAHDSAMTDRMKTNQPIDAPSKTIDGRLIWLSKDSINNMINSRKDTKVGCFGKVYIPKMHVQEFNRRVAIKEIDLRCKSCMKFKTHKQGSVSNETIASGLRHFGIVPLLAFHDDRLEEKYYLLTPYLENGDLFQAIAADRKKCDNTNITLTSAIRLKIMYHIASAIEFMHTGNNFRGPVLHMDINSKNIVLDGKNNARLIDFGNARGLKEGDALSSITSTSVESPGYCPTCQHTLLKKQNDYHNFGVVLLELITGLEPFAKVEGLELRKCHTSLILQRKQKYIWDTDAVVQKVSKMAVQCIASITGESPITAEEIVIFFKKMCRQESAPEWNVIEDGRCEICLVNEQMKVGYDGHDNGFTCSSMCHRQIRICCSCMRNLHINPIKCYTCGKTIEPFINANWGAILVAGYDEQFGEDFKKNIRQFKTVITSNVLPSMNPQNVIITDEDMKDTNADGKIDQAFDKLSKTDVQTLLFVYSGRNDESGFQVGRNVHYQIEKICDKLNKWQEENTMFGKVIALFDCRFPIQWNLNNSLKVFQLMATSTADADKKDGSTLLQHVINAFTAGENRQRCTREGCKCSDHIKNDFITLHDLFNYINEHVKDDHLNINMSIPDHAEVELKDTILAYNYKFKMEFEFIFQWHTLETLRLSKFVKEIMHVPLGEFDEFSKLKEILASKVLKLVYDLEAVGRDTISKFAEIIIIEINNGCMLEDVQVIDNVELLMTAWNLKRQLRCTDRQIHNIGVDKPVGRCLNMAQEEIKTVHQAVLRKCNMTEHQLTRPNLLRYLKQLKAACKYRSDCDLFISAVDMIIYQAEKQLQDARLDLSFHDLPKTFTLVSMNLVNTTCV